MVDVKVPEVGESITEGVLVEWSVKNGDVVQIDPNYQDARFAGCFMQVTEPKGFGAQGFIRVPGGGGDAYFRSAFEDMELIGHAAWVPTDVEETT